MKELIKDIKDFKIIPTNFESSSAFTLKDISDSTFDIELEIKDEKELKDYQINSLVEVFGVNNMGLVYFETTIKDRVENIITLNLTDDYSVIQRREYSRVNLQNGKIVFKDLANNFVKDVCDISAGGIKFTAREPLNIDREYDLEISLSNNMKIECSMKPIRISGKDDDYTISGKFTQIENADRIVLVQYAFKIKMEKQNIENE